MYWRFTKDRNFNLISEELMLVPEFHNLMMAKDGAKLMELIVKCYYIFSPNQEIEEQEREEKVSKELFGEWRKALLKQDVYIAARDEYIKRCTDIDVEEYRSTEHGISKLIKDRKDLTDKPTALEEDDLKKIKIITETLKMLIVEKEELYEKIMNLIKAGKIGKTKMIGGKNMSWLQKKNDVG